MILRISFFDNEFSLEAFCFQLKSFGWQHGLTYILSSSNELGPVYMEVGDSR